MHGLHTVSWRLDSTPHAWWMYSPLLTFRRLVACTDWLLAFVVLPTIMVIVRLSSTMGLHRVQLAHTASDVAVHATRSYTPVSPPRARHWVHGLHTRSENSVHGLLSQKPGAHSVHRAQTLSIVSSCAVRLLLQTLRFT